MEIVIFIFSLIVFYKTFLYGIYEIKENKNIISGIAIIIISIFCLIGLNVVMKIR